MLIVSMSSCLVSIWSAEHGDPDAKRQLDDVLPLIDVFPFDWSLFPFVLSLNVTVKNTATHLLTFLNLNRLNLILTSNEVCET